MIRKLIFDLDNTLIIWKDEYVNALKETLNKYGNNADPNYVNDLVDSYEDYYDRYDINDMLNHINKNIDDKINMDFMNDFLDRIGYMSEPDEDVISTLEYLSKNYELVVLTNWFTIPQTNRLKNAHIDKYFNKIYGGEDFIKPNKQAFIKAAGDTKLSECIMIGDNYNIDVMGAYNAGIKPIFMNPKHKENLNNFEEIEKLSDLKNIL